MTSGCIAGASVDPGVACRDRRLRRTFRWASLLIAGLMSAVGDGAAAERPVETRTLPQTGPSYRLRGATQAKPRTFPASSSRQRQPARPTPDDAMQELKRFSGRAHALAHRQAGRLSDAFFSQKGAGRPGGAIAQTSGPAGRGAIQGRTDIDEAPLRRYAHAQAERLEEGFFRGRYDRSRARLAENIALWRQRVDIANPGPDLANFPNSAFTLPAGRAYVEISPLTYYGSAEGSPAQYNAEFLLRYGLTDDVEFRIFGNGVSWSGGSASAWGFAPIAFDTKIQLWTEKPDWYLPAAAAEAYLQTQWFGSRPFNGGTQPAITLNFDQSLPFEIDLEYNLGATRVQSIDGENVWEESFQWALQRDFFGEDFALFVHGFYNAMTLPRLPNVRVTSAQLGEGKQNAVGLGFIWTVDQRLAIYGQMSGGTTASTPSTIGMLGFAAAF